MIDDATRLRVLVAGLAALVAVSVLNPARWWCGDSSRGHESDEAYAQPWAPRELLQEHIDAGYKKQVERLYALLAEGYLTRPESEPEENVKFLRGLRSARRARAKAIDMIMREPFEAVTPLPLPPLPKRPSDAPRSDGPANTR